MSHSWRWIACKGDTPRIEMSRVTRVTLLNKSDLCTYERVMPLHHHIMENMDYRSLLQKNPTKETIDLQLDCHLLQKNP